MNSTSATLQATNLDFNDLCYWHKRAAELLGQPVTIIAPDPIIFMRHDFTGDTGIIRPINSTQFTIDDIDGILWTIGEVGGLVEISGDGERSYLGYWHEGKAYFSECGCQREDLDPRIAFAQVICNI